MLRIHSKSTGSYFSPVENVTYVDRANSERGHIRRIQVAGQKGYVYTRSVDVTVKILTSDLSDGIYPIITIHSSKCNYSTIGEHTMFPSGNANGYTMFRYYAHETDVVSLRISDHSAIVGVTWSGGYTGGQIEVNSSVTLTATLQRRRLEYKPVYSYSVGNGIDVSITNPNPVPVTCTVDYFVIWDGKLEYAHDGLYRYQFVIPANSTDYDCGMDTDSMACYIRFNFEDVKDGSAFEHCWECFYVGSEWSTMETGFTFPDAIAYNVAQSGLYHYAGDGNDYPDTQVSVYSGNPFKVTVKIKTPIDTRTVTLDAGSTSCYYEEDVPENEYGTWQILTVTSFDEPRISSDYGSSLTLDDMSNSSGIGDL